MLVNLVTNSEGIRIRRPGLTSSGMHVGKISTSALSWRSMLTNTHEPMTTQLQQQCGDHAASHALPFCSATWTHKAASHCVAADLKSCSTSQQSRRVCPVIAGNAKQRSIEVGSSLQMHKWTKLLHEVTVPDIYITATVSTVDSFLLVCPSAQDHALSFLGVCEVN